MRCKTKLTEKSPSAIENQMFIQQKLDEARKIRKLSKKNEKIKFRREVQTVKDNIEKRDKIWLSEKKMMDEKKPG
jgi:hypothetical protein